MQRDHSVRFMGRFLQGGHASNLGLPKSLDTWEKCYDKFGNGHCLFEALCGILACAGSGRGVGLAGEAGAGVIAEDPSKFAQCLI